MLYLLCVSSPWDCLDWNHDSQHWSNWLTMAQQQWRLPVRRTLQATAHGASCRTYASPKGLKCKWAVIHMMLHIICYLLHILRVVLSPNLSLLNAPALQQVVFGVYEKNASTSVLVELATKIQCEWYYMFYCCSEYYFLLPVVHSTSITNTTYYKEHFFRQPTTLPTAAATSLVVSQPY